MTVETGYRNETARELWDEGRVQAIFNNEVKVDILCLSGQMAVIWKQTGV